MPWVKLLPWKKVWIDGPEKRVDSVKPGKSRKRKASASVKRHKSKRQKPSLEPQHISNNVWYYEHRRGLEFVVEPTTTHAVFVVPKRKLLESLKRIR